MGRRRLLSGTDAAFLSAWFLVEPSVCIAAAPVYFDIGGFFGRVLGYIAGLMVLFSIRAVATPGARKWINAIIVVFALYPFMWFAYFVYDDHMSKKAAEERARRGAIETQENFIKFCRERGDAIDACKKYPQ